MIELELITATGPKKVKFQSRPEAQEHIDREYSFGRVNQKEWSRLFDILSRISADGKSKC